MRQAPAHGAAMTDRQVADQATGLGDDRQLPPDRAGPLERVLSRQRADGQARVHRPDVRQLGDAVHVDQDLGLGEPEVQERHQALSPGQDLRTIPMLGEQGHGFVGGAGRLVLEGRRFHGGLPLVIDRTRTLGEGLSVAREGAAVNAGGRRCSSTHDTGDGPASRARLDGDGRARLGQRKPAGLRPLAGQQGDDGEGTVGDGRARSEIAQGLGQRLDIGEDGGCHGEDAALVLLFSLVASGR